MNGTDPTGAGWFAFAAVLALIAAGAVAIDVGVRTGDVGAALKAGAVTFLSSMAIAVGVDAGLGIVATHVSPATMETVTNVLAVAGLASGGYGVAEAARNGMYATAVVGALLLAAGAYRLLGGGRSTGAGQAPAGADQPPRDLNQREKEILESVVGPDVDWSKVKLDEGFRGERYARGQVRSDFEINVESGYSGWTDEGRKFGLLTHEGVHIWQRQQGLLNNFGGAIRHLWSWLTHFGNPGAIYRVDPGFRGSFWELNFEQQAAVVGDWVALNLSPVAPVMGPQTGLPPVMVERLYLEFRYGPRPF